MFSLFKEEVIVPMFDLHFRKIQVQGFWLTQVPPRTKYKSRNQNSMHCTEHQPVMSDANGTSTAVQLNRFMYISFLQWLCEVYSGCAYATLCLFVCSGSRVSQATKHDKKCLNK